MREYVDIPTNQLENIHMYMNISNRLVEVIKTTILNLDEDTPIDLVARRINQSFKKDPTNEASLFLVEGNNQKK
ncbi:MAG: hypothetical protein JXR34_08835 [Bacteroidales bacterium]|nr:hypothetical protein [Bacteroidales bacterium]